MTTGEWSKDGATIAKECIEAIFTALPKTKQREYLGELNEVLVFLENAKQNAPAMDTPR